MKKFLTPAERDFLITEFAKQNNIEPAVLAAIVEVESTGSGFYPESSPYAGKCTVRFEADYFQKFANAKPFFLPPNVSIEDAKRDSRYNGRLAYEQALLQSPTAAIKATSFGLGQIMGFNYQLIGYNSLTDFTLDMEESEYYQLYVMVKFITAQPPLLVAAQQKDFSLIARFYNGPKYIEREYDKKLITAYNKISGGFINV